jgi:hypothetical protein
VLRFRRASTGWLSPICENYTCGQEDWELTTRSSICQYLCGPSLDLNMTLEERSKKHSEVLIKFLAAEKLKHALGNWHPRATSLCVPYSGRLRRSTSGAHAQYGSFQCQSNGKSSEKNCFNEPVSLVSLEDQQRVSDRLQLQYKESPRLCEGSAAIRSSNTQASDSYHWVIDKARGSPPNGCRPPSRDLQRRVPCPGSGFGLRCLL